MSEQFQLEPHPAKQKEYGVIGSFERNTRQYQEKHTCELCGGPVWLARSSLRVLAEHGEAKVAKICNKCALRDKRVAAQHLNVLPEIVADDLGISVEQARVLIDGSKGIIEQIMQRARKIDPTKKNP